MVRLKTSEEIAAIGKSGRILALVLKKITKAAKPGANLSSLDKLAAEIMASRGAESAFFRYCPAGAPRPYPAHICASLNDVIVHGIPDAYKLRKGDLLKIDIGVRYKNFISDAAVTLAIGPISRSVRRLIRGTKEALTVGVKAAKIGNHLGDIGYAIQKIAQKNRLSIIDGLAGHGVGFAPHEDPLVHNFGRPGSGPALKEGMVIAIEPMFSLGSPKTVELRDGSFATLDRSLSAHFEHTVAITKRGPQILTL